MGLGPAMTQLKWRPGHLQATALRAHISFSVKNPHRHRSFPTGCGRSSNRGNSCSAVVLTIARL